MTAMETVDIFKALANDTRLTILMWLKEPEKYFPPQGIHIPEGDSFDLFNNNRGKYQNAFQRTDCETADRRGQSLY